MLNARFCIAWFVSKYATKYLSVRVRSSAITFRCDCVPKRLTEAIKCKCLAEASQVVLLFNNRCGALHFPLLESVQIEEGPCQNSLRGSEEKYSQSPAHKGDMKKGEKGGEGESEIRSDSTQKCMWEHIIKKRGVFVWVCTLWSELIATGILGLLRVKTPQKAFQRLSIRFCASATFYLYFKFVFAQSYNHFYLQFGQINTNARDLKIQRLNTLITSDSHQKKNKLKKPKQPATGVPDLLCTL